MKKIEMVDLKSQYKNIKSEIDAAIQDVLDSGEFVKGKKVTEFENALANYLGVKHVIACANGTDALQIALMALGLKPGDEVVTVSFTFIATAEVIALLGLKPVFVDVNPDDFNINIEALAKAITPKTKAIIPVHLFGQPCNMQAIKEIANKHKIFIIEDAAQSLGAYYVGANGNKQFTTGIGHIGCTSFFPSKNLGCYGDGGALMTNNDQVAEQIRLVANHGMKRRYYHDAIGVNSRLDTIQAGILSVKLKNLDSYNEARKKAAAYYDENLKGIKEIVTPVRTQDDHIYHQYTLRVLGGKRDELRAHLESLNIPAMIYYPVPIHLQVAYSYAGCKLGDLPVTEQLINEVLSLPMHTELDLEQLNYICSSIKSFFKI